MQNLTPLIILLPIFSSAVIGIWGFISDSFRKQEKIIGGFATLSVFISFFILFFTFLNYVQGQPVNFSIIKWIATKNISVDFSYTLDPLSLVMGMVVTGVGGIIHLYSIGYMHGDRGYYRYFMFLNLFIFFMLNLVLADNLLVLFLGWEGVGACSYFLIGFWYEDMAKSAAALKAFIVNRIGDFAFLIGMFLVFKYVGSLNFLNIGATVNQLPSEIIFWIGLLFFIGATGKSAQIPLLVWLPDAMAGPTPVSALIHAATMVTAGVYLIARLSILYISQDALMLLIAGVAALTAIVSATIALTQNDIKKVLAYSTISQLGFMFLALGVGAFTAAIFHLVTHAFFKACLFLGSGSVIHAMNGEQDIRKMGGLRKYLPHTRNTFWIAALAISGIPPLAGFFSKDEIISSAFAAGHGNGLYYIFFGIAMLTAVLTATYMTRLSMLTFEGGHRFSHDIRPHESPMVMTLPLWILAVLSVVGGFIGLPHIISEGKFNWVTEHWLGTVVLNRTLHLETGTEIFLMLLSITIAVGIFYWAMLKFRKGLAYDDVLKQKLGGLYKFFEMKYYFDELYQSLIVNPFISFGQKIAYPFDKYFIDGIVNGTAKFFIYIAGILRKIQTGLVQTYALAMVIGILLMLGYLLFF